MSAIPITQIVPERISGCEALGGQPPQVVEGEMTVTLERAATMAPAEGESGVVELKTIETG